MAGNVRLPILLEERPSEERLSSRELPEEHDKTTSGELLQVGDLARETGKTVRAIHLYEELQLLRPAARSKGRYRLYEQEALVRVRWIGKLQDMGFSLSDIQTIVRDWEESGSAPRAMVKMRNVYKKKLDETRENLRKLAALEGEIVRSLDYLDTCDVCEPSRLLSSCGKCEHHDCNTEVPELVAGFRHKHQSIDARDARVQDNVPNPPDPT
jgi:DNA-binding transcriptional MerR regulator